MYDIGIAVFRKAGGMKIISRVPVYQGKFIRVVDKHFLTDSGREGVWESIERTNIFDRGAVIIIAVTRDKEMLFERNYRFASESWVIQFPAGLTDIKGETEEEAARRELLEETGYRADKLIPVIASPLSPDLTSTVGMHFFAPDVELVSAPHRDLAEKIEVVKVPLARIHDYLENLPPNTFVDLRVTGVLWYIEKRGLI